MARSVRRWAVVACLASGAVATAQPWPAVPASTPVHGSPPPAPKYEPSTPADDAIFVIRTAGQADRTVRVVHPAAEPDGLAEVKDTATGQTFNIPNKVLAKLPRANAPHTDPVPAQPAEPKPAPTPDTKPQPEPKPQFNPSAVQPESKPQPKPSPTPLPQLPATTSRTTKPEPAPPVVTVHGPPVPAGEKMVVTWQADDPPPATPSKPAPPSGTPPADPWRSAMPDRPTPIVPSPTAAKEPGPRLTPAPTWRPSVPPTTPGDPWRPSGG